MKRIPNQFYCRLAGSAMLLLGAPACAQTIQQVTVSAPKTGEREQSTTTAIVVGRDDIVRHGDSTLADVLKRQPGITIDGVPGRPAGIRMRGLSNGYVAVLLNGLPAPAGFSLESISPDMVERIEIMRAASAEFSSQAIAGTINVVLRKGGSEARRELKLGTGVASGRLAPSVKAERSDRMGAFGYTLGVTAKRSDVETPIAVLEEGTGPSLLRTARALDRLTEDSLELAPRLSWQPAGGDTWTSQSYLRLRRIDNPIRELETTLVDEPTAYPDWQTRYRARPRYWYSDLSWTRRLEDGARVSTKVSGYVNKRESDFVFFGADPAGVPATVHRVASGPRETDLTLLGSYRRSLGEAHALAAGWEAGRKRRSEDRREQQFDATGALTLDSDEEYSAKVERTALFVQDEWDITPRWSLYMGVRREDVHTVGAGNAHEAVDLHSGVWSPVAQTLVKTGEGGTGTRDQFRFAVSRTYKPPQIGQLMPRRYTVDNNNSPSNPDQQGNPNLKPELAWSVDAAWERYFGKDNLVSVATYAKRIRDVTLYRISQQGGAWIVSPGNDGNATVRGIELEAKLGWHALAGRANLARNWSRVEQVPGPDNRLDGQPAVTASLGLDYQPGASAFAAGGSFSYRSGVLARQSAVEGSFEGAKRGLDLYGVWKVAPASKLRLSAANLLHQDYPEQLLYADGTRSQARMLTRRTFAQWRVSWEQGW